MKEKTCENCGELVHNHGTLHQVCPECGMEIDFNESEFADFDENWDP